MSVRCILDFPQEKNGDRERRVFENPHCVLTAKTFAEVPDVLRNVESHAKQGRWAVGMVSYEAAPAFDRAFSVLPPAPTVPLAAFAVFDKETPASSEKTSETFTCTPWRDTTSRNAFLEKVERIRQDIAAGLYYQTNLTTRLTADFNGNPEAFFEALRKAQPDGYSLFLDFGDWQIASVSPELFFAWDPQTGQLVTRPMKGTAPPSDSDESLRASEKDRAENLMIVDLLRNDMSRIADNVRVPELFTVQRLPTLLQMTSTITGVTKPDVGLFDLFAALFPCGSITGAPKIAAMKAIAAYENAPRGAYCGALGIVRPGGASLFSVGIRSVTLAKGKAVCGIGSGITWDSKPVGEYEEGRIKQRFLWRASASFDLLESLKLEDGVYGLLSRHTERLERAAAFFGFPFERKEIERALSDVAACRSVGLYAVRLLLSREGDIKTDIRPFPVSPPNPLVALATNPVSSDDPFLSHKTTNRAVYEAHAPTTPDLFDTLLFNEHGEMTEFTRGNIAVEQDGQLVTPPETCGLLRGTLRDALLANGTLIERVVLREDLDRASALWFLNSLRGMMKVRLLV